MTCQKHNVIEELEEHLVRKKQPKQRSKRAFGPLTPSSERPLVLPGGRRWYRPKDAYNDEFIAETLSAQAELITGSTLGWVNAPLPLFLSLPPLPTPTWHMLAQSSDGGESLCQLQLAWLKPYCAPYCHGHSHQSHRHRHRHHSHHSRSLIVIVSSHAAPLMLISHFPWHAYNNNNICHDDCNNCHNDNNNCHNNNNCNDATATRVARRLRPSP